MISVDELVKHFAAFNMSASEEVLQKCVELCLTYKYNEENFVDQWLAFSATHLGGAGPAMDTLGRLERSELQKQARLNAMKTPKRQPEPIITTPKQQSVRKEIVHVQVHSPAVQKAEKTVNDENTPTQRYNQRKDALVVLCSFGKCEGAFKHCSTLDFKIKILNDGMANCRYMYEKMPARAHCINRITKSVTSEIIKNFQLEPTMHSLKAFTGEVIVYGRIYPECEGRPTAQSLVLENCMEVHKGHRVSLKINNLNKYALFSGQCVVVKGNNNSNRNYLVAHEIYTGAPLQFPLSSVVFEEPVQIVVAAGPFTLPDNLMYDPMKDLLKYVVEYKPNFLILIGPFLDVDHEPLANDEEFSNDVFFEFLLSGIVEQLKDIHTKLILIPSPNDAHGHNIFPTPAFRKIPKRFANVIFAPNPCVLNINDLVIGAMSVDVLFHLSKQEVFCDKKPTVASDRMARLVSHLLSQKNFYPLHPPEVGAKKLNFQFLEAFGRLHTAPHFLILPSNLRYFIKKLEGTIAINPERLTKGHVAGTFCRIEIQPGNTNDITERTSCQILRI